MKKMKDSLTLQLENFESSVSGERCPVTQCNNPVQPVYMRATPFNNKSKLIDEDLEAVTMRDSLKLELRRALRK
jgi:hypothetical protein